MLLWAAPPPVVLVVAVTDPPNVLPDPKPLSALPPPQSAWCECDGISLTVSVCSASPPVLPAAYVDPAHSRNRSWMRCHVPPKSVCGLVLDVLRYMAPTG